MVIGTSLDRKARFRVALALKSMTQSEWAENEGITPSHLSQTLSGRASRKLETKIDEFVSETFRAHKVRAA